MKSIFVTSAVLAMFIAVPAYAAGVAVSIESEVPFNAFDCVIERGSLERTSVILPSLAVDDWLTVPVISNVYPTIRFAGGVRGSKTLNNVPLFTIEGSGIHTVQISSKHCVITKADGSGTPMNVDHVNVTPSSEQGIVLKKEERLQPVLKAKFIEGEDNLVVLAVEGGKPGIVYKFYRGGGTEESIDTVYQVKHTDYGETVPFIARSDEGVLETSVNIPELLTVPQKEVTQKGWLIAAFVFALVAAYEVHAYTHTSVAVKR